MDHSAEAVDKVRKMVVGQGKRRRDALPEWRRREGVRMVQSVQEQHNYIMRGGPAPRATNAR